jgi:hypothetical protein
LTSGRLREWIRARRHSRETERLLVLVHKCLTTEK